MSKINSYSDLPLQKNTFLKMQDFYRLVFVVFLSVSNSFIN